MIPSHLLFVPLLLILAGHGFAQSDSSGDSSAADDDVFGNGSLPVDISAEDGLEWRRSEHLYIARGKAKAVRGGGTAEADILMAFYDDTGKNLQRLVGQGNVTLTSGNTVMTGDNGEYDAIERFLRLTGQNLSIKTKNQIITADKSIDYWTAEQIIKTRGNSKIVEKTTIITSNNSTIYLHKDGPKKGDAYQVESNGNVKVVTSKQTATANKLIHNIEKDVTVLLGNVLIVEGDRRIRGEKAEIDHKTGISRILSGGNRVRVNINPNNPSGGGSPNNSSGGGPPNNSTPSTP
jgi:lipopolysaccharide export system protein LptA